MLRTKNLIALLLAISFGFSVIQAQERRPHRYLIPEEYVGWVRINFNVADAPSLPIEDDHYLFKIPLSGLLETSSDLDGGWASDQFFSYSDDKRKKLELFTDDNCKGVWDGPILTKKTGVMDSDGREVVITNYYWFVGTKEDYKNRKYEEIDRKYYPKVGNVRIKGNKN